MDEVQGMTQDDIIKLAREAGFDPHDMSADFTCNLTDIERFAALVAAHALSNIDPSSFMSYQEGFAAGVAAEREKVAAWMIQRSYATGHGDTVEDLLKELEWQIREAEREACLKLFDAYLLTSDPGPLRARGETK